MSGGHFDYNQWRISEIADSIEDYINGYPLENERAEKDYIDDLYFWDNEKAKEAKKYVREHHRTIPNFDGYSEATIAEFRRGLDILRRAFVYAQRIDWLLSGDDGEESFHERLTQELDELNKEGQA